MVKVSILGPAFDSKVNTTGPGLDKEALTQPGIASENVTTETMNGPLSSAIKAGVDAGVIESISKTPDTKLVPEQTPTTGDGTGGETGDGTGGELTPPASTYVPLGEKRDATYKGVASEDNKATGILSAMGESPAYTQSTDKSAGSASASGTQYSWDKQGQTQAQTQYQQDVLKAKQDALSNRQTIEQNALQYQQQADMMKYANNQNAEKVGWTGGYVLDQNRQMEYLKASIQAQMYGAMELQKYGYDTSLAAARLSYDLNQQQFAHQYYQDAVNLAISEAQITGTYFSAETRDMMSQLNIANQELGDLKDMSLEEITEGLANGSLSLSPEQTRALEVRRNIESWYSANGVSTQGIQTLAAWESEMALLQQHNTQQWEMYQAALDAANTKEANNANIFIELDSEGNPVYNGSTVSTLDFRTMSSEDISAYVASSGEKGKSQVFGYVDGLFEKDILDYAASATTVSADEITTLLNNNIKARELGRDLGGYEYSTICNGDSVKITIDKTGDVKVEVTASAENTAKAAANSELKTKVQATLSGDTMYTTSVTSADILNTKFNNSEETYADHVTFNIQSSAINGEGIDDDFDVDLMWDGERAKNYDIDVDWKYGNGWQRFWSSNNFGKNDEIDGAKGAAAWDKAQLYLKQTYANQTTDTFVLYGGSLWYYNASLGKWGYVQDGAGGAKLKDDFIEAASGNKPARWYS